MLAIFVEIGYFIDNMRLQSFLSTKAEVFNRYRMVKSV